jgi:uncharacterized spore protein YtfJ
MGEGIRLVDRLQGAASVSRAFGEPVRQGELVILPVASVRGGGGGGDGGGQSDGRGEGGGAGFGLRVVPCGVFVIRGDRIRWQPAVDVNRVVLGGQVVALALILTVRSLLLRRGRTGRFLR